MFKVAYCQSFSRNDFEMDGEVCEEFVRNVKAHNPLLMNRPKFHLILHLPECMLDFGRTSSFNTERYVHIKANCTLDSIYTFSPGVNLSMDR